MRRDPRRWLLGLNKGTCYENVADADAFHCECGLNLRFVIVIEIMCIEKTKIRVEVRMSISFYIKYNK